MKTKYKTQIKNIMDNFDFDRVVEIMICVNWRWRDEIPSTDEIRKTAEGLLKEVVNDKLRFASSGGFTAFKYKGKLDLFFGVDSLIITDIDYGL